jgi:selenocysteine lyase/cysteine desulfurase
VQHTDGAVLPVREICQAARERGTISIVEGALALGAVSLSLHDFNCDFYSASFSHWLNSPPHAGVLYVRRESQALLDYPSTHLGELFDVDPSQWPTLLGKLPEEFVQFAPQFQAVPAALSLQEGLGRARIEARLRELTLYTRLQLQNAANIQILTPSAPGMWTSMLALRSSRHTGLELASWLRKNDQVVARGYNQNTQNALRISLHIYRLVQGLLRAVRS